MLSGGCLAAAPIIINYLIGHLQQRLYLIAAVGNQSEAVATPGRPIWFSGGDKTNEEFLVNHFQFPIKPIPPEPNLDKLYHTDNRSLLIETKTTVSI